MWKNAGWLAFQSFKMSKRFILFNWFLFLFAFGLNIVSNNAMEEPLNEGYSWLYALFLNLIFGMAMAWPIFLKKAHFSFESLRHNPFHRELSFYFSLPINAKTFLLSRVILIAFTAILQYGTIFALISYRLSGTLTSIQVFAFLLYYISFSIIIMAIFLYIEYAVHAKLYMWVTTGILVVFSLLWVLINKWTAIGWVLYTFLLLSKDYSLVMPITLFIFSNTIVTLLFPYWTSRIQKTHLM